MLLRVLPLIGLLVAFVLASGGMIAGSQTPSPEPAKIRPYDPLP
jgi:hypothetical protein